MPMGRWAAGRSSAQAQRPAQVEHRVQQEVAVLEGHQQADVENDGQPHQFPDSRSAVQLVDPQPDDVVARNRGEHHQNEELLAPGVEDQAGQQEDHVAQARSQPEVERQH